MKRLLYLGMFISLIIGQAHAATTIAGTMRNPDGSGFTGTLLLSLSQEAAISSAGACGGPLLAAPVTQVKVSFVNGSISNSPVQVYGSDCTMPTGIPYNVKGVDSSGNTLFTDQWLITGSTFDVGNPTEVQAGQGVVMGVIGPIVSNPVGNQSINQPSGTALTINNLTVTGVFTIPVGTTIAANSANTATQLAVTPTNCTDINGNTGFVPSDGFLGFAVGIAANGNALCVQPFFNQIAGFVQPAQYDLDNLSSGIGYTPLSPVLLATANGIATLDSSGLVPIGQIPLTAIASALGTGGGGSGNFLPLTGGTMQGEITAPDDNQTGSQLVTANYVLNQVGPVTVTAGNAYSLALKAVQLIAVGQPNGVPQLDATGLVPVAQLPYASATNDGIITAAQFTQFVTALSGGGGGGGGSIILPANAIPYEGTLGTNPIAATFDKIVAMFKIGSGACTGTSVLQADGQCGPMSTSTGVGTDSNGHLQAMPEVQTQTSSGTTTFVCSEDHDYGRYDARCFRAEKLDGNNSVVNIYTSPALAAQEVLNEATCWTAKNGRSATVVFPPGTFQVGISTEPTLTVGSGVHVIGVPTWGQTLTGSGGTIFEGSYTNSTVFQEQASYGVTCPDGTSATDTEGGGDIEGIMVIGCQQGGCSNLSTDTNTYVGGGPSNVGMQFNMTQGKVHNVRAAYTGGPGIIAQGTDTEYDDLYAYAALGWYRYDRGSIGGVAYNPSTDGIHGGVQLDANGGRFSHIEAVGAAVSPGSQGTGANERGHVCGVSMGGDNIHVNEVQESADERGICRPNSTGNVGGQISNFHAINNMIENLYSADNTFTWSNGTSVSGCLDHASVLALGTCTDLNDASANGNLWSAVTITDDSTDYGTSYRTGYITPGFGKFSGVNQNDVVFSVQSKPTSNTVKCVLNQVVAGVNSTSQFGFFRCDSQNDITNTYHWTFYPLTAGSF